MIRGVLTEAGFELRIGVERGEVAVVYNEVTELSDLEGTAVSMAAAAAEPGEVLISHKMFHYIESKDNFRFIPRQVKLKKSIGDKRASDALSCYAVESIKGK